MDEQKKSESSWDEAERVGPYQIHEQVPQDEYSQVAPPTPRAFEP